MKKLKIYLIIALGFLLISCEKVIVVDLDTAPPRLVIDASINWVKNTLGNEQKIKLTTTTGYYSTEFPVVSGANVVILNSSMTAFNFTENTGTGEYICQNFVPIIGETYTLKINYNGESYSATEVLTAVPDIENTIDQNNNGGMGSDEIEITYYYQDDGTQQNNYLYQVTNPHVAFPQYSVENDENSQGKLTPVFYSHKDLKPGDSLNIQLFGISKRYFDYFKKVLNASGNDDSPFSTTPSSVRGNIINESNSSNYVYGYFRLSEVAVKNYTIKE